MMGDTAPLPRLVAISELKTHPDQHLYDGTLAEADEQALYEDLRANGQRDPIKVLTDGTVLDGHQRIRLLRKLGHDSVLAVAVEVDGDTYQQRAAFLRQNMSRRQLNALQHAKLELRLYEAENSLPVGEATNPSRWSAVRTIMLGRLKGSDRHINRVLRVVLLPDTVIAAVEQGRLKMVLAEKLDQLDRDTLAGVVEAIESGLESDQDINAIVDATLPVPQRKRDLDRDLRRAFDAIETIEQHYDDQIGNLKHRRWGQHLPRCTAAKATLDRVFQSIEATTLNPKLPEALPDTIEEPFGE